MTIGPVLDFNKDTRIGQNIADARLHDLPYGYASHTVMNGESMHLASGLLGCRRFGNYRL